MMAGKAFVVEPLLVADWNDCCFSATALEVDCSMRCFGSWKGCCAPAAFEGPHVAAPLAASVAIAGLND